MLLIVSFPGVVRLLTFRMGVESEVTKAAPLRLVVLLTLFPTMELMRTRPVDTKFVVRELMLALDPVCVVVVRVDTLAVCVAIELTRTEPVDRIPAFKVLGTVRLPLESSK
jgi:hypothetical protein